jgi:hypothetical protein
MSIRLDAQHFHYIELGNMMEDELNAPTTSKLLEVPLII